MDSTKETWALDENYVWHFCYPHDSVDFQGRSCGVQIRPECGNYRWLSSVLTTPGENDVICPECREIATRMVVERREETT